MWEELYQKHCKELRRYAARACGNEAEAEDVVQETFLKALQNAHIFEDLGPSQQRAWLYRTMKNELCDRFRREKLEQIGLEDWQEEAVLDPGMQAAENQLLLSLLEPEDRTLFHLRYEAGYTSAELAELFNMPAGTIRARLSRCRQLLKQSLKLWRES